MKPTRLWDINEAILLLDTLLTIREKGISRKEAVRSISSELQLRAIKQGMELDNTYHKPKDIDQQMYGLEYVLTNGKTGLKKYAGSAAFKKVVSIYQTNRESFEEAVKALRDPINNLQTEPRTEKKEQSSTQPVATETSADSKESSNTEIRNAKIMNRAAEAILEDKTLNKYAYFTELTKDRAESANMLEKPSMRGIKNSVVEKYSDQAHFIYELLQNADDANATFARFILEPDRLIFAHNGTRHFSVSNPATEEYDSENGDLGDINAITSIANSNKTTASIGKFGVGFKAVFQYTTSPFIYDPDFCFRIERFIVPVQLDEDFSDRKPGETLFVFPFNHPDRSVKEAYKDIADKLKNLSFPQLFLTNLKDIQFEAGEVLGQYKKRIAHKRTIEATIREKVELTKSIGDETQKESLWLFSRQDEYRRQYSVGFFLDSEGHLKPVNEPAFCFFPTKEYTGLHFILHAPFLLTDSREGIRAGVLYNDRTIQRLANLAADALVYLRDIGKRGPVRLIDDDILKIIPIDTDRFSDPEDRRTVSFLPFYQKILAKFQTDELVPGLNGYSSHQNAYWATSNQLPQLFSDQQLGDLVENENAQWAFPSLGRDSIDSKRRNYIDSLVYTNVGDEAILTGRKKGTYIYRGVTQSLEQVRGITAEFIAAQSYAWLHRFYKWLSESKRRREMVKTKPIFLNQNSEAVSAFDNHGRNILFLPVKDVDGYNVVNQALLSKKETKEFFGEFGIKHPSLKDQIYNKILPFYESRKQIDSSAHFKMLFDYYCKCANDELDEFVAALNQYKILSFHLDQAPETYRGAGKTMYFPRKDLIEYFSIKKGVRFLAIEELTLE